MKNNRIFKKILICFIPAFLILAGCEKSEMDKNYKKLFSQKFNSGLRWIYKINGAEMLDGFDKNASYIGRIPNFEEVLLLEQKDKIIFVNNDYGSWTKIRYQGKECWVFGGNLKKFDVKKFITKLNISEVIDYEMNKYEKIDSANINAVRENYVLLSFNTADKKNNDFYKNFALYRYDNNAWYEIFQDRIFDAHLLYVNADDKVDYIVTGGSDSGKYLKIFFSQNGIFKEALSLKGMYKIMAYGFGEPLSVYNTDDNRIYKYNMKENKFE